MAKAESLEVRGLVLGAGRGTRLHPLTRETSKHLLLVGDKPLIVYAIEQLLKAGIKDILLLIDHRHASQFMQLLQDGSHLGVNSLAYVWQPPEGKGIPSAIAQTEHLVKNGRLVVVCGDVIIENGINKPVADFLKQTNGARLVGMPVEDTAGYSPLQIKNDNVVGILDKDKNRHIQGVIDLGVYMYNLDVFKKIRKLSSSARGETEIWELNKFYAEEGLLYHTKIDGWWSDVGNNIETYLVAHKRYDR